jgi:hypothetical protein
MFFIIISALHVLGGFSTHHQELIKLCVQPWVLSCFPAVYHWCGWVGTVPFPSLSFQVFLPYLLLCSSYCSTLFYVFTISFLFISIHFIISLYICLFLYSLIPLLFCFTSPFYFHFLRFCLFYCLSYSCMPFLSYS